MKLETELCALNFYPTPNYKKRKHTNKNIFLCVRVEKEDVNYVTIERAIKRKKMWSKEEKNNCGFLGYTERNNVPDT